MRVSDSWTTDLALVVGGPLAVGCPVVTSTSLCLSLGGADVVGAPRNAQAIWRDQRHLSTMFAACEMMDGSERLSSPPI
jgi:hypothetical protein